MALALIEGYGSGRLVIEDWRERDGFAPEVDASMQMDATEVIASALEIGGRLHHGRQRETDGRHGS